MKLRVSEFFRVEEWLILRMDQFIVADLFHDVEMLQPFGIGHTVWLGRYVISTIFIVISSLSRNLKVLSTRFAWSR